MLAPATASGMKSRHEGGREQICAHRQCLAPLAPMLYPLPSVCGIAVPQ